MSCLELTHFLHVAVFIPLLLPFLSRDSLQFYMVLCFNSHPGGDSISFSSIFSDVTVFVVQITEGFSRSQSRKEKKVTDRESPGTKKSFVQVVYFWGYFFLGLDVPKLVILTELQRRISPVFFGGDVMLMD